MKNTKHSGKKVVIVGAGFGGLNAAKALGNLKGIDVTLIDRKNHHLFQPLLYQVAMADLNPSEIAVPIRSQLRKFDNVHVLLGDVVDVRLAERQVQTDFTTLPYDYLVLACGAKDSYFGRPDWENYAPGLKTLEQATEIRRRVLLSFELAERETDIQLKNQLQTVIVVGGGPTGVELVGALAEICRHTLVRDFDNINPARTRIILIESNRRILSSFPEELAKKATEDLESLGVHVWTNRRVTDINDRGVALGEEFLRAGTVIWAAGVEPSPMNQILQKSASVVLDKRGRVVVGPDLMIPAYPGVFVIGDQACVASSDDSNAEPLPGLASVAIQQGKHVGRTISAMVAEKPFKNFLYRDKGQLATIGRNKAVAKIGRLKLTGVMAWLVWLFVHIYYLIGFNNKVSVFAEWAYSYFTYKRTVRLILSREWKQQILGELPGIMDKQKGIQDTSKP